MVKGKVNKEVSPSIYPFLFSSRVKKGTYQRNSVRALKTEEMAKGQKAP
jgi:hypothetical protein